MSAFVLDDDACKMAFAEMWLAYQRLRFGWGGRLQETYRDRVLDFEARIVNGERSPEFASQMQTLAESMKGSTP